MEDENLLTDNEVLALMLTIITMLLGIVIGAVISAESLITTSILVGIIAMLAVAIKSYLRSTK